MTNRTCTIDGCTNPIYYKTLGYCNKHYQRFRKYGDPLKTMRILTDSAEESFELRTEWQGECLIWTGALANKGYGAIWDGERIWKAHVWHWTKINGPVPKGKWLDHRCHTPACCNLDHLRIVTTKQNMENLKGPNKGSRSGVRGVHWCKKTNKWRGRVKHNYQEHAAGYFETVAEAEQAVIELRNKLFTHNDLDRVA